MRRREAAAGGHGGADAGAGGGFSLLEALAGFSEGGLLTTHVLRHLEYSDAVRLMSMCRGVREAVKGGTASCEGAGLETVSSSTPILAIAPFLKLRPFAGVVFTLYGDGIHPQPPRSRARVYHDDEIANLLRVHQLTLFKLSPRNLVECAPLLAGLRASTSLRVLRLTNCRIATLAVFSGVHSLSLRECKRDRGLGAAGVVGGAVDVTMLSIRNSFEHGRWLDLAGARCSELCLEGMSRLRPGALALAASGVRSLRAQDVPLTDEMVAGAPALERLCLYMCGALKRLVLPPATRMLSVHRCSLLEHVDARRSRLESIILPSARDNHTTDPRVLLPPSVRRVVLWYGTLRVHGARRAAGEAFDRPMGCSDEVARAVAALGVRTSFEYTGNTSHIHTEMFCEAPVRTGRDMCTCWKIHEDRL